MRTIAVLGLGEAGRLYARGLREAGADVRGYDPHHELGDPSIRQCAELADALAGADVVVSLVGASAAASIAHDALPVMPDAAIYALVCRTGGFQAGEAVFIDDNLPNVEGARAFGMHAVHHRSAAETVEALRKLGFPA